MPVQLILVSKLILAQVTFETLELKVDNSDVSFQVFTTFKFPATSFATKSEMGENTGFNPTNKKSQKSNGILEPIFFVGTKK